jgi:hypothetical protein
MTTSTKIFIDMCFSRVLFLLLLLFANLFLQAFNYISNKGYARMSREDEKVGTNFVFVIHSLERNNEPLADLDSFYFLIFS